MQIGSAGVNRFPECQKKTHYNPALEVMQVSFLSGNFL